MYFCLQLPSLQHNSLRFMTSCSTSAGINHRLGCLCIKWCHLCWQLLLNSALACALHMSVLSIFDSAQVPCASRLGLQIPAVLS